MNKIVRFVKDESGATAIEYGLIAAATGIALATMFPLLKTSLESTFTTVNEGL